MSICLEAPTEKLGLAELACYCAEELQRQRRKQATDGHFCLELVRRATLLQMDEAWELLVHLFGENVLIWLRTHPGYSLALTYDSEENYAALTFTRFWSALRDQRLHFTNLPTVLSYLHATLNSTVIDTLRSYIRLKCVSLFDPVIAEIAVEETYDDDSVWNTVQSLLENAEERQVMYLLYYCGFKPRELVERFSEQFSDVKEVYRLNHNIIERLRRKRERLRWLLSSQETEPALI
ncbi:MAG TPA: hypothetical protein VGD98_23410 [Ktedonobacteraceae bacterium]